MEPEIKQGGLYRHYKGNLYRVLCVARHTESGESLVVYRDENAPEKVWARPASMWNEKVVCGDSEMLRFTFTGD